MKKVFVSLNVIAICLVAIFILTKCGKDNATSKQIPASSTEGFKEHIIPATEAKEMIKRYDESIGSVLENTYKQKSSEYISPNTVIYDVEPLLKYLTYIKEHGSDKVMIRFAAIDGDNKNGRIVGMPYHSVVLFGNKKKQVKSASLTNENDDIYFDAGTLVPPPYPPDDY